MKDFSNIVNFRIKDIDIKKSLSNYMKANIGHHLWVSKKVSGMDELLMEIITEMYPELSEKINLTIGIKNNKNKRLL